MLNEKIAQLEELMVDKAIAALEAGKITTVEGLEILANMIDKIAPVRHMDDVKDPVLPVKVPQDTL